MNLTSHALFRSHVMFSSSSHIHSNPFFNFAKYIIPKVGLDFILLNTDHYMLKQKSITDVLFGASQGMVLLSLVESPESPFLGINVATSIFNVCRLGVAGTFASADLALTSIISKIIPNTSPFSNDKARQRAIKRIIGTMSQSGRVYHEFARIIRNMISVCQPIPEMKIYVDCVNNSFIEKRPGYRHKYFHDVKRLFERELQIPFDSVMYLREEKINYQARKYKARLLSGEPVQITILPRNVEFQQSCDLFPYKVLRKLFSIIPGCDIPEAFFSTLINRVSISFEKEVKVRKELLSELGVDFDKRPKEIFKRANQTSLSMFIPAPLPMFCSQHIMVTQDVPHEKKVSINSRRFRKLMNSAADLLFLHHRVVPDLSRKNIRVIDDKIYLKKYSSIVDFSNEKLSGSIILHRGAILKSKRAIQKGGKYLGLGPSMLQQIVASKHVPFSVNNKIIAQNMPMALGFAESITNLENHRRSSKCSPMSYTPIALGFAAKTFSPNMSHKSIPFGLFTPLQYIPF